MPAINPADPDKDYIYEIVDWKNSPVRAALVSCGLFLAVFICYIFILFNAKLRDSLWAKIYDKPCNSKIIKN